MKNNLVARQRLIRAIIKAYGGPTAAADYASKKLGKELSYHTFVNWRVRGKVPLEYVRELSDLFEVPIEALNYLQADAIVEDVSDWNETVEKCKPLSVKTKEIIKNLWLKE